jgi:hypothetical protein
MASAEETEGPPLLGAMVVTVADTCCCSSELVAAAMEAVWERRWAISSSEELNRRPQKSRPCIQLHM